MTTNEEILRKECVFTSNWKLEKHRNGITECTYAFLDKIMSLARQDEQNKIIDHLGIKVKEAYEKGAKDEAKKIFEKLDKCDRSAPCMECGSVQCAICFKHIEKIKKEYEVE